MSEDKPKHEYIGNTVSVASGPLVAFTGTILGFGVVTDPIHKSRDLVHVQDENGEAGWYELNEISVQTRPVIRDLGPGGIETIDDLENWIERQIINVVRQRRKSSSSAQVKAALGGRHLALSDVREVVRKLRAVHVEPKE